jgi:hypothetical protein
MKRSIRRLLLLMAVVMSFVIVQAAWAGADGMQGDNPYVPGQARGRQTFTLWTNSN